MGRLRLDPKDRLILANQFQILEKLYPDEAESYAKYRKIVQSGYELCYDWMIGQFSDPMSDDQCREVIEILDMYRRLRNSYAELPAGQQQGIRARDLDFPGFDGNNESEYLGLHEFFQSQDKWQELPAINSHIPTLETYRRMLAGYEPFKHNDRLTAAQIIQILAERVHPDRR